MGRRDRVRTRGRAPQHGHTPRHAAALKGHLEVAGLLVAKGADKDVSSLVRGGREEDVVRTKIARVSCWGLH